MGIGTSLGAYYDTSFNHQAGIENGVMKPPDTGDDNVQPPDDKPAPKSEAPQPVAAAGPIPDEGIRVNPWITIKPEDVDTAIGIAMSAGAGTMQGIKGGTFDRGMLYKAQDLEMNGTHPDDIWSQTGTTRGADSRWRQEIDDSTATLKPEAFETKTWNNPDAGGESVDTVSLKAPPTPKLTFTGNNDFKDISDWLNAKKIQAQTPALHLPDVLDHPELFKAYPDLKAVRVEPLPEAIQENTNVVGHMSEDGPAGTLRLKDNLDPEYAKSVIMHEVQHRIQRIEGFATGGNAEQFLPRELKPAEEGFKKARDEVIPAIKEKGYSDKEINTIKWASQLEPETMEILKKNSDPTLKLLDKAKEDGVYNSLSNIAKSEKLIADAKNEAFDKYQRLMGEVESRNVQTRRRMDDQNRKLAPPQSTEDHARSEQIPSPFTKEPASSIDQLHKEYYSIPLEDRQKLLTELSNEK